MSTQFRHPVLLALTLVLVACGEDDNDTTAEPFALRFAAVADGQEVGCGAPINGLGSGASASAQLADLRFYVSNLKAYDKDGRDVAVTLDSNAFQYANAVGQVSLVDLTGNSGGACDASAIAFAEGTSRTNDVITGSTRLDAVKRISFDVGVPQALMRDVIANSTAEGAPSPLAEMYWSWQSGYRHFVMNMAVSNAGAPGEAYVHIGSRDCGSAGQKALTDRDACTFVNNPTVDLQVDGLRERTVTLDIPSILAAVDFVAPLYDSETFEVIGETVGVECHSSPMQPDCGAIFPSFGLAMDTGDADASADRVFGAK